MQKFYTAYDIFGRGNYCWEDFSVVYWENRYLAESSVNTQACDEWCSYGGLHGIGYGEEDIEEKIEEGLSKEEVLEEEWQDAENSVDYVVYTEEEFKNFLKEEGYNSEEIEKILLDLESKP